MRLLRFVLLAVGMTAAMAGPMQAEDVTVKSLIGQGFTVVSMFMSQIGPGLFLQNGDKLYLCFVTETRNSQVIATNYCKVVE